MIIKDKDEINFSNRFGLANSLHTYKHLTLKYITSDFAELDVILIWVLMPHIYKKLFSNVLHTK